MRAAAGRRVRWSRRSLSDRHETPSGPPLAAAGRGGRSVTVTRPDDHRRAAAGRGGRSATVTRPLCQQLRAVGGGDRKGLGRREAVRRCAPSPAAGLAAGRGGRSATVSETRRPRRDPCQQLRAASGGDRQAWDDGGSTASRAVAGRRAAAGRGGRSATVTRPLASSCGPWMVATERVGDEEAVRRCPPSPAAGLAGRGGRSATVTRPEDHRRLAAGGGGRAATVTRPDDHGRVRWSRRSLSDRHETPESGAIPRPNLFHFEQMFDRINPCPPPPSSTPPLPHSPVSSGRLSGAPTCSRPPWRWAG